MYDSFSEGVNHGIVQEIVKLGVFVIAHSCYFSSMQNSERGKKIGNAVMSTSRSVVQTGKAVGKINNRFNSSLVNSFLFHIELISHTICSSSTKPPHCACSTCHLQCLVKVFIPCIFSPTFCMLQPYAKMFFFCFFYINLHFTAHNDKAKYTFVRTYCKFIKKQKMK